MRLHVPALLSVLLLVGACGSDGGGITLSKDQPDDTFDAALCDDFDESDGPSDELLEGLPKRFEEAATAVKDFGSTMDSMSSGLGDELAAILTKDGIAGDLEELAAFAEEQCGQTEGGDAIGMLASASTLAGEEKVDAYCAALESDLDTASSEDGAGSDMADRIGALATDAPESHRAAIDALAAAGDGSSSAEDENVLFGAIFGVGLYAEATCGIEDAFQNMLLFGAFASGGDPGTEFDEPDDSGDETTDTVPAVDPSSVPAADPSTANAFVPAGAPLTFGTIAMDLEEDGDGTYLASLVVPSGWSPEYFFDVTIEPPAESGYEMFTTMNVGTGCDGMCEATDWEARLRAADGYLSTYISGQDGATERAVAGSEGTVVMGAPGSGDAVVLRWDDTKDKYFKCEVDLDGADVDLIEAFVAACESARPSWIAVG